MMWGYYSGKGKACGEKFLLFLEQRQFRPSHNINPTESKLSKPPQMELLQSPPYGACLILKIGYEIASITCGKYD
jgi:hypothetical protein